MQVKNSAKTSTLKTEDPKATIFNIQKFSVHDGRGIRTTIFFQGCPLNCWWCHNPESQSFTHIQSNTKEYSASNLYEIVEKERIFYDESNGGITISGGEPLMQHAFLQVFLKKCRENELHTTIDTSGYSTPKKFAEIALLTDMFLFDLKFINCANHKKYTGVDNHDILLNFKYLINNNIPLQVRIPIIPSITSTEKNIKELIDFLLQNNYNRIINLLPFHSIAAAKYNKFGFENKLKEMLPPDEIFMLKIRNIFVERGLTQVIIGG